MVEVEDAGGDEEGSDSSADLPPPQARLVHAATVIESSLIVRMTDCAPQTRGRQRTNRHDGPGRKAYVEAFDDPLGEIIWPYHRIA